ncbi:MAG: hypothetical protein H5U40_02770, partial [Polyangiaceae bacterium]|nr:hypothetical protein [Polyangiaceae bacterium]
MSRSPSSAALLFASALALSACGGASRNLAAPREPSPLERLRAEAEANPNDAALIARLAEGELL